MHEKLFLHFKESGTMEGLNTLQIEKFKLACKKVVDENPTLNFDGYVVACRIYLYYIKNLPELDLGPAVKE